MKKRIEITLMNEQIIQWEVGTGEMDGYTYDGRSFVIKKNGEIVGLYNMDYIISVTVN